jgi:hypothetical protein
MKIFSIRYVILGIVKYQAIYSLFKLKRYPKKITKLNFKKKKTRNRFKPTGFSSVRFFGQPVQTYLTRFFPVFF